MDIKKIAQTLNLNSETTNRVLDAWSQAQQMGSGVKTKQDALNLLANKGIDAKKLETVGKYLNHPMANVIAGFAGVNIDKVRKDFASLSGSSSTEVQQPKTNNVNSTGVIDKYRKGLKQL